MNELEVFKNEEFGEIRVVAIDNEPWFVAKDVSDNLGYAQTSNMMKRIDNEDFKSSILDGMNMKSILINESGLYSAILGSKLESAKRFKHWVTSEVLPTIRKTGSYGMPQREELSPQLQVLINMEMEQKRQAEKIDQLDSKVDSIKDVVALNPNDWRKDTSKLLSKMALNLGGYEHIKQLREESYRYLDERMGVSLNTRLTNKRRRMADEGICKSKRDKLNQLDVIADDKKLIEGYVAIIKEMAIKYGISVQEVA